MEDQKKQIFDATNGGLDIFLHLYPHLKDYKDSKKNFSSPFRYGDSNPSAHFYWTDGVCIIKDFAMTKAMNAIDAWMKEKHATFKEAMQQICEEFGIDDGGRKREPRNATYECLPNTQGKADGIYYVTRPATLSEIRFMCPYANAETLKKLHYEAVEYYSYVKGNNEHVYRSREGYPIFVRTCNMIDREGNIVKTCHKMYQPLFRKGQNGKSYKFMYIEQGMRPDTIVNGLLEIKEARDRGEKNIRGCMVTGERDANCCMANGIYPIWFNGEGHCITDYEMKLIRQYVNELYYIPDIDGPGKRFGMENMHKFPELKTVWLPEEMKSRLSDQRKSCKDLRDYVGMYKDPNVFFGLLNGAHSYKFACSNPKKPEQIIVSADDMRYMLKMNGYRKMYDGKQKQYVFVRIEHGKVVSKVTEAQIRTFVTQEIESYSPSERDKVLTSKVLEKNIKDIEETKLDFTSGTARSQVFHTRDKSFIVSAEGINEIENGETNYVWEDKVIGHDVELLPMMFNFSRGIDPVTFSNNYFPVEFVDDKCKAALYVQRLSRLHWLKIDEGKQLTDMEQYENAKNLQAMIFAIGHLLCKHNERDNNFAPYLFEYDRYDGAGRAGRTGKTTLFTQLLPLMGREVVKIDIKKEEDIDKQFSMQQVSSTTDIVFYDEIYENMPLTKIYENVSNGISFEQKHKDKVTFDFKDNPRNCCASNFDPSDFDPSTLGRFMYIPVGHYYHVKSPNTPFHDTRTIATDFGMTLWDDCYPEEDYNRDINFLMQCVHYYLSIRSQTSERLEAPLAKVMERHNEQLTENDMTKWANVYFNNEPAHLNCEIPRDTAMEQYNQWLIQHNKKPVKSTGFTKQLKAWIATQEGMVYNPEDKCTEPQAQRIKHGTTYYIYIGKNDDTIPF